jgi:phosphoglycerate dehydrogenase-like enzyme
MSLDVLCLRPEVDFLRAGVSPPERLKIAYRAPGDVDVPQLMRQVRALVIPAVGPKLPPEMFENTSVKFVQVTGAGLDRLDQTVLQGRGIQVANVPGGSNHAVAEYVIATASVLLRRFSWCDAEIRRGNYNAFRVRLLADVLPGLDGLAAGIIGMGTIGLAVAEAFHKMRCRVSYYDPAPRHPNIAQALGAQSRPLDDLLKTSDVISIHVPLLPETQGMLGEPQLALMKAGAVLIQASRGGVLDEAALAASLQSGHLGGAAVDVYSKEPPDPENPLLALQGDAARKILFTPHIAGVTRQASAYLYQTAWRNVERVLLGSEPPSNRVY